MNGFNRWAAAALAVLVAVGIGAAAYQAGVTHGLALQVPAGTTFPVVPYGWYHPWGFGFGLGPFFFVLLWLFVIRGIFWGGRRRWYYRHWDGVPPHFEDWHRRAHDRMKSDAPPSPTNL